MKKQKTEKAVVLFCLITVCFLSPFLREIKAEDAFIVEEEAIIGGESTGESAPAPAPDSVFPIPVPVLPTPAPLVSTPPQKDISQEVMPQEVLPQKGDSRSKGSEKQDNDGTISQNSTVPVFRIPVKRPDAEKDVAQDVREIKTEQRPERETAAKTEEKPQEDNPWWLLAAGGIFFLGGCIRILWRAGGRASHRGN
ncbi:MAG: hypothetical protein IJ429_02385 [Lachnospiraceae bacterium]|nr:hypothetical protein [Lachnospiraceae bacterium]